MGHAGAAGGGRGRRDHGVAGLTEKLGCVDVLVERLYVWRDKVASSAYRLKGGGWRILCRVQYESSYELSTLLCFVLCDFGELYKLLSLGGLGRAGIGKGRHNNIRTIGYNQKYTSAKSTLTS